MSERLPTDRIALRPAEAARALGVSIRTLRDWMRNEGLPYVHLRNVVLIPCGALSRWLDERVGANQRTDALVDGILGDLTSKKA